MVHPVDMTSGKKSKVPTGTGSGTPDTTSNSNDVADFLNKVRSLGPSAQDSGGGRLIFAMDATASREPTWDMACHIQGEMFQETDALGGLSVQLVFYRGFRECKASKWYANSGALLKAMTGVYCLGGQTQIRKVLNHTLKEMEKHRVNALVLVGDAFEEDIDEVCHIAGQIGLRGVPIFCFHEGGEPIARRAFEQIAKLTKGAYCPFDASSAQQLKTLLAAVAVYAAGGHRALMSYSKGKGGEVLRLTSQVKG